MDYLINYIRITKYISGERIKWISFLLCTTKINLRCIKDFTLTKKLKETHRAVQVAFLESIILIGNSFSI